MLFLSLGADCVYTIPPPPPPAVTVVPSRPYPGAVWVDGYCVGEGGGTAMFGCPGIGR